MNPSDALRSADTVFKPDPRCMPNWSTWEAATRSPDIQHRIDLLQQYVLSEHVPESVRIHFETAKNVYLYAWFVYRFNMVAEQYLYATLELALRVRLHPPDGEIRTGRPPTLGTMLRKAHRQRILDNQKFTLVQEAATQRARARYDIEIARQMAEYGLSERAYNYSNVQPTEEDYAAFGLPIWEKTLPALRNTHAHGTASLWPMRLTNFQIVVELIEQLFSEGQTTSGVGN